MDKNRIIELIRPNRDFVIRSKIKKSPLFARAVIWINDFGKENNPIHPSDVRDFFIIQAQNASMLLTEFCLLGLIRKEIKSKNFTCYVLEMNSDKPMVERYIADAKKALGII